MLPKKHTLKFKFKTNEQREKTINKRTTNRITQNRCYKRFLYFHQLEKWIKTCEIQAEIFLKADIQTSQISSNAMAQAYWNVKLRLIAYNVYLISACENTPIALIKE
jgi:hypothetical protein